jgi:hypothetical protein
VTDLANATRHFTLIRSKDAGPFMLTLDLFFTDADARRAFVSAGVFSAERIAELYRVDPVQVQIFELADIDALKISFPRPVASGEFGDTDITGGQQYAILVDMISELEIDGEGADLVVRDPGRG